MTARRTIALLAVCASLAAARPSGAAAPAIARVEGAITGSDLTVTMWYADRAPQPAGSYAPDRDGGWGCQLYLQGRGGGLEVDGIQAKDGAAPVLSLEAVPGAALWSGRLLGTAAIEPRPRALVVRLPLAWLGGSAAALPYRVQLYSMRDLGADYNHVLRSELVAEYGGMLAAPGVRTGPAGAALAATDIAPAIAGSTWGALRARYR